MTNPDVGGELVLRRSAVFVELHDHAVIYLPWESASLALNPVAHVIARSFETPTHPLVVIEELAREAGLSRDVAEQWVVMVLEALLSAAALVPPGHDDEYPAGKLTRFPVPPSP